MSGLPPATRAALDKIATTGSLGRRPTTAHPHCRCNRPVFYLARCPVRDCGAGTNTDCEHVPWRLLAREGVPCPVHR